MPIRGVCMAILVVMLSGIKMAFAEDTPRTLLVWGDSLSAAYNLNVSEGWVALLEQRLKIQDTTKNLKIVNGSISGETTSGGLTRLPAALEEHKPQYMILELGANDGLRGLSIKAMRDNLESMIKLAQDKNTKVMLLGMYMPANYGKQYSENYTKTFKELAETYKLPFVPFFLDGVALQDELLLPDGLHPNTKGQPKLLDNVWPSVEQLLELTPDTPTTTTTAPAPAPAPAPAN